MLSLIHIANGRKHGGMFPPIFLDALKKIGDLQIVEQGKALSDEEKMALLQKADVALTGWNSAPLPAAIVDHPGKLRYVCNITGTMSGFVPKEIVASDMLVSNWGDNAARPIAEGTVALLLGAMKDFHEQVVTLRDGEWGLDGKHCGGTLYNAALGVYGCGAIGSRFIHLIKAFGPQITVYDPYCETLPEECSRAETLRALFETSQILVVCAGVSDETCGSITAELLALLPDHAVVVNTARGEIFDQDALFAELERGRLRAGLDVVVPDGKIAPDHPLRQYKNCIFTGHEIARGWPSNGEPPKSLSYMHQVCIGNLKAFAAGEPIRFTMSLDRFLRST